MRYTKGQWVTHDASRQIMRVRQDQAADGADADHVLCEWRDSTEWHAHLYYVRSIPAAELRISLASESSLRCEGYLLDAEADFAASEALTKKGRGPR